MQPHEWEIILELVGGLAVVLGSVAGFLAVKVISHGEKLASLTAHQDDVGRRFDQQDTILTSLNSKLDALLLRFNVHTTPPRG